MFVSEDSAALDRRLARRSGAAPRGRPPRHRRGRVGALRRRRASRRTGSPYILSVSSIYRYKNYVRLIEAYTALARRRDDVPDLVIIGDDQDPEYSAQMERARAAAGELAERIHLLGEVPYAEIKALLRGRGALRVPVLPRDLRSSAARGDGERSSDAWPPTSRCSARSRRRRALRRSPQDRMRSRARWRRPCSRRARARRWSSAGGSACGVRLGRDRAAPVALFDEVLSETA